MNGIQKAICSMLPPADADAYRAKIEAEERKHARLESEVRNNCAEAIQDIGSALRYPRISADHLEIAISRLAVALTAAKELDK